MSNRFFVRITFLAFAGALIFMTVSHNEPGMAAAHDTNPLTHKWVGPYGGIPPFDKVKVADFKPALESAMAENLAEIDKIASNPAAPTFENTIVEMERTGATLDRVTTIYFVWGGNMATPDYQTVQREMAPKLSAMSDKITQNAELFKRIEAVYNSPDKKKLTAEQQRKAFGHKIPLWFQLSIQFYLNFACRHEVVDIYSPIAISKMNGSTYFNELIPTYAYRLVSLL
jgi:peptidyl-dipeptidase Dcp